MDYSDKVIEHFMCPRNVGTMPDADAEGSYGDMDCGDSLTIYLKIKDQTISEISFLVFGCGAAVAASSIFTVLAKGKSIEEALQISGQDVMKALDGLPPNKLHCSVLGPQALRRAIEEYQKKS